MDVERHSYQQWASVSLCPPGNRPQATYCGNIPALKRGSPSIWCAYAAKGARSEQKSELIPTAVPVPIWGESFGRQRSWCAWKRGRPAHYHARAGKRPATPAEE